MKMAAEAVYLGNNDFAEDIAKSLATLTDYSLDSMLLAWVDRNYFWPAVIFRGAGESIRDGVIKALESGKANANHALSALSWIGDSVVQERFRDWEGIPAPWRRGLHVGPASYAHVAGWELSPNGRHDLFHQECWAATPCPSECDAFASVRFMCEVDQKCPWCNRRLVNLVEIDPMDDRFSFLGVREKRLAILTCDVCSCYGMSFMYARISADGVAFLAEENKRPDWLPNDLASWGRSPWMNEPVRLQQRRAIHAVDWCMAVSASQIGGMPSWVQDTAYPSCPDCSKTMTFVAQVDNGQFPGFEGIYYAFLCSSCRVSATTYQQT
jgi:hypothetical protein